MQQIIVRNQSSLPDAAFHANIAAVNLQLQGEFVQAWPALDAMCIAAPAGTTEDAVGTYNVVFLDAGDPSQPDALAYHLQEGTGFPLSRIFLEPLIASGDITGSVGFSHEVIEMLVDPPATLTADSGHGYLMAYEAADPVEGDTYAAPNGVLVSNFVFPAYFQSNWPAGSKQLDHLQLLTTPFQIRRTGYADIFIDGAWTTTFGPQADRARIRHRKRG